MKVFIFLFSLVLSYSVCAQKAWLVVDGQSGKVILEHNANVQRYPASLTKMMVLYVVFDALKKGILEEGQLLTVSKRAASQVPSKLGLVPGEKISVKEAVLGLIIKSANDAAVVLSEHLSGKEETFANIMTRAAKQIGLSKTNFKNASGLSDDAQVSTAKDMALLGMALYQHFPRYYKWFSKKSFWFQGVQIKTHNHLLKSYPGTDGLKTGYIRKSGFNSIVSVEQKGKRLFGVVLGANSVDARDLKMIDILNKAFRKRGVYSKRHIITGGYIVQLGAFSNLKNAQRLINQFNAAKKITIKKIDNKILYVALLTGLSRQEARLKCSKLKRQGQDCFIKQP